MLVFVTLHYKVLCLECPLSADAWERASQALQCKDPNYYHCLRDDNGLVVEHCLGKLWIQPGMYRSQSMAANNYKMICDVILVLFYIVVQFDIESVLSYCQECVRSTTREWPGLTSLSAPAPPVQSLCTGPTPCTCVRTPNSGTCYYILSHATIHLLVII